nr:hypothetical protein [Mangrovivirga cuniculi]
MSIVFACSKPAITSGSSPKIPSKPGDETEEVANSVPILLLAWSVNFEYQAL